MVNNLDLLLLRYDILGNKNRTLHAEGLSNLNYELKKMEKNLLFTHFFVEYDKNYFLKEISK